MPRWPKTVSTPSTSIPDWHWLAGIFEGEGTAVMRSSRKHKQRSLYAAVYQTNRAMLEEVRCIAGRGKIYPQAAATGNHKAQWAWHVASKTAREFLNELLPYIRSPHKREQVIVCLAADIEARKQGREVIKLTLAAGSRKRWEAARAKVS